MTTQYNSLNDRKWKRKILTIYWILFVIYLAAELASLIAGWRPEPNFLKAYLYHEVAVPLTTILLSVLTLEILSRYSKWNLDYMFIVAVTAMGGSLVITNASLPVTQAVMIVPISISVVFFDKRKILFATAASLVFIVFFYAFFNDEMNRDHIYYSLIIFSFILIGCCTSGMIAINRGTELLQNLSEKINSEAKLRAEREWAETIANNDGLTGLPNHKSFHDNLDRMIAAFQPNKDLLHLALMDIDNFKSVNDTYGHWVGDIVLKRVADKLKEGLENHAYIARYGGEEFGVLFQGRTDSEVLDLLEELRIGIEWIHFPEMDGRSVTVSIGMHKLEQSETKETLFKLTDGALYKAKRSGKNMLCNSE